MNGLLLAYEKFLSETMSQNTLFSYMRDLMKFLGMTNTIVAEDLLKITTGDIERYVSSLKNKGMAYSSIARVIASLKKFFAYCKSRGLIKSNPAEHVETMPIQRKLPNTLTADQVVRLLEAPDINTLKGKRDKAMLEVMYACGAKVSELLDLKASDVSLKTEIIILSGGRKRRTVPLGRAAIDALADYIRNARVEMMRDAETDVLFLNLQGSPMTRQGFWKMIKGYISKTGIKGNITAQTLRHCFALHLLENGADAKSVSEMLGYSDVASTKIYMDVMNNKIRKVYQEAHPRA